MKLANHTAAANEAPCTFAKQVLLIVGSHHCGASHAVGRTDHLMGISGSGITAEAEAVAVGGAGMNTGEVRDAPNAAHVVNSVSVGLEGAGALAADGAVSGASTTLPGSVMVVSEAVGA